MNLFKIKYFSESADGLRGSDFERADETTEINLDFLSSLSELKKFTLPFSGDFKGKYALITMSNSDKYYIREAEYKKLSDFLQIIRS